MFERIHSSVPVGSRSIPAQLVSSSLYICLSQFFRPFTPQRATPEMSGTSARRDEASSHRQYRGVRLRRWGKWVCEIRDPTTRTRIWLGSFRSAEEAAYAYDAAVVCIRGPNSQPNFPHHTPTIPSGTPDHYTRREIQAAAAASAAASVGRPFNYSGFRSPDASEMSANEGGEELEDITYTDGNQQESAPDQATAQTRISNNNWSCNTGTNFDDPYEREWVNNMIYAPAGPAKDDSDDDNNSFVEASLWNYWRWTLETITTTHFSSIQNFTASPAATRWEFHRSAYANVMTAQLGCCNGYWTCNGVFTLLITASKSSREFCISGSVSAAQSLNWVPFQTRN